MLGTIFLWTLVGTVCGQAQFAENLSQCTAKSPIDVCLRSTLEELRALMPIGIPELGLRKTEPFIIRGLEFRHGEGPVVVTSRFRNVNVSGLSSFVTNDIHTHAKSKRIFLSIGVPVIDIEGFYEIDGNIFVFPIQGDGPFTARLFGVNGEGGAKVDTVVGADGEQTLLVNDLDIDFTINRIEINMMNLFGGKQPVLAQTVNNFLNDNGRLVLDEIKPKIKEEMVVLIGKVLNDAFSQLSAEDLIANIENSDVTENRGFRTTN